MIVRSSMPRSKTVAAASCAAVLALSAVAAAVHGETGPMGRLLPSSFALAPRAGFADPEQEAQWREIQATRQANLQQIKSILDTAIATLGADSASAEDLRLLVQTTEAAVDELIVGMRVNRDRYLELYAQLDPQRQAELREELALNLDRLNRLLSLVAVFP